MAVFLFPLAHLMIIDQAQQLLDDPDSPDLILEERKLEAADKVGETVQEKKNLKTFLDHMPDYLLKGDEALVDHLQDQEQEKIFRESKRSAKKQMIHAIEQGNLEWLEQAISRGVQADGCDKNERPYFIHAVEFERTQIMGRLLELGVNVDIRNDRDRTGLDLAIGYGNVYLAEFLLDRGASLDEIPRLQPALHLACSTKHMKMVEFLVNRGLDIEQPSSDDMRPLDFAIRNRRLDTVKYLIALGADVHHAFHYNVTTHTPLTLAVWERSADIVKRLIQAGADPSAAPPGADPPLFLATGDVNPEIVKILLASGADADARNLQGDDAVRYVEYQERRPLDDIAEVVQLVRSYQK